MMLVGMSDPGLLILPTHRLVSGFPGLTAERACRPGSSPNSRSRKPAPEKPAAAPPGSRSSKAASRTCSASARSADGRWLLARLRSDAAMDRLAPEHSADWRSLGVSVLQVLVLGELLAKEGKPSCRYVHLISEVLADVAARGCDLACLVPAARMSHVEAIASNLETMPPKSTYFYPKLLTGLVLNPIRRIEGA